MKKQKLMLGNEAISRGLLENGCEMATAYPGTPSSEILSSLAVWKKEEAVEIHTQWSVNEKVAFEIAYAGSQSGLRTAVAMKQVGLNVASDPLMSAAYIGTKGGFLVISADDPGPHSSQTEQDSRLQAMMAKIPVLDPDSPKQAKEMVKLAYEISESFEIPVMLRPTTRICHSRQNIVTEEIFLLKRDAAFEKNPLRWAATPKFRHQLHKKLEKKLSAIAAFENTAPVLLNKNLSQNKKVIIVSGVAASHSKDILKDLNLWDDIPLFQVLQPYPLHTMFIEQILASYDEILVIEETVGVIEMQIADRNKVHGKIAQFVSSVGELFPEKIEKIICRFTGLQHKEISVPSIPGKRPTLCAGCPHRASFFAIKKAAKKGIYTSDIGCYTLGLNLGAVDTVLCMGAAVSQAAGFAIAYQYSKKKPDIVATIGDSTFFHSGIAPLVDAVVQKIPFVLVILDNSTTAMTGNQSTPATGVGVDGKKLDTVDIPSIVKGCGVTFCRQGNPYNLPELTDLLKKAVAHCKNNGPAVVISKFPCLLKLDKKRISEQFIPVVISDKCDGCGYCIKHFECPALVPDEKNNSIVSVDEMICSGCGVCLNVCINAAIEKKTGFIRDGEQYK